MTSLPASLIALSCLLAGLLLTAAFLALAIPRYRRERREAIARVSAGGQTIQTPQGRLEYAVVGQGIPIVVMHGAGGSYEQGLILPMLLDPKQYKIVAISRPGYWGTPLAVGLTHAEQVDAAIALMDALKIKKAAVLGISAGGPPALAFALRRPERCSALILVSAVGPGLVQGVNVSVLTGLLAVVFRVMLSLDFLMWLMVKPGPAPILMSGGMLDFSVLRDPARRPIIDVIVRGVWPTIEWKAGVLNDIAQVGSLQQTPIDQVRVPTLVVHGTRDAAVPYGVGKFAAERIPGARFLTIPGGSHFAIATHRDEIAAAIIDLLMQA